MNRLPQDVSTFASVAWTISLICSALVAPLVFFPGMSAANGAPQECAVAGIVLCVAVVPYCVARAVKELRL